MNTVINLNQEVAELRDAWMFVGKAFQDGCDHCKSCAFKELHRERVGLFPNVAEQVTSLCMLGKNGERPDQCPALIADRIADIDSDSESYLHKDTIRAAYMIRS